MQAQWPTLLFNQGHCGCWGATPPLDDPSITNNFSATASLLPSSLSSPAASTHSDKDRIRSEDDDTQNKGASLFGLLITEGGNAAAAGEIGNREEGIVDKASSATATATAAVVSLLPAGRKRNAPNPGSDPRVSTFRLCPQVNST